MQLKKNIVFAASTFLIILLLIILPNASLFETRIENFVLMLLLNIFLYFFIRIAIGHVWLTGILLGFVSPIATLMTGGIMGGMLLENTVLPDMFIYAIYLLPSFFTVLYCPWYIVKGKESIKSIHLQYRWQTDSQIEQVVTDQIKMIVFFTTPLFLLVIFVGNIILAYTKIPDLNIKFDQFFFPVLISVGLLRGLVEWITYRTKYAAID